MSTDLYALVMAGGRGTRFWPVSRRCRPKQCVSLTGDRTLLQATIDRLAPLIPPERVLVLTGPDMAPLVREQLHGLPAENILVEPSPRNTAPCIALGAAEVARRAGGQARVAVLPADHHIGAPAVLRDVLSAAARAAQQTNALCTVGIEPRRPDPGFGYLQVGVKMGEWGGQAFHMVERFTEKPDVETATRWLEGGQHLWNAGMFVFTVDALRDALREHLPGASMAMAALVHDPRCLPEVWPTMEATSIDYGIMEKSRHILTVPCDPEWSDVGAWGSAAEVLPNNEAGRGHAQRVLAVDAHNCVVHAPKKTVAVVGLDDIVVVDTDDAILVMHKNRAPSLRSLLNRLDTEAPELT